MKQIVLVLLIALACALTMTTNVPAQQSEDVKPGQTFPRPGYFPDPEKVVYVICWHHKKNVYQFGYQDYFMDQDGVNDTTARKMKQLMEERYPNLVVYVKETNERDAEAVIERERKRIKFIDKDWVDVKQPAKIQPPKRSRDKRYHYSRLVIDESAPKGSVGPKAKRTYYLEARHLNGFSGFGPIESVFRGTAYSKLKGPFTRAEANAAMKEAEAMKCGLESSYEIEIRIVDKAKKE